VSEAVRKSLRKHVSPSVNWIGGFFRKLRFALAWRTEALFSLYANGSRRV